MVGLSTARKRAEEEEEEADDPEDLPIIRVQRGVTFGCSRRLTSLNGVYHQLGAALITKSNAPIVVSEGSTFR